VNSHPDEQIALARRAYVLDAYRRDRMGPQATELDAFLEFAKFEQHNVDEASSLLARVSTSTDLDVAALAEIPAIENSRK